MTSLAKILVVDDAPQNVRLFKQILTLQGYPVVTAGSGAEALEVVARESPQLILLDVIMPGMSGHDVCRALRANPATATVPVVMVTGLDAVDERARCLEAGADDVVSKPFSRDDLLGRVRTQLRLKALSDTVAAHERRLGAGDRRLQRNQGEVVASMSHELRTPLNAIIGFAELLYEGLVDPSTPQHKEYLGDILSSGRQLLRVIDDLVDVARVETGAIQLRSEPVSVELLVMQVCAAATPVATARAIRLEVEIDPRVTVVEVDPARFKLVLRNALDEAIRMSREAGRVVIRAKPEDADLFCVEVEDESPLDVRPRKGEVPALPRRMIEFMGGTSSLRRGPSGGSVFSLLLPLGPTSVLPAQT